MAVLCCYCEAGDIEGATRVLDQMRALDLEITENVYAALITGEGGHVTSSQVREVM